jgi:glycosidase
MVAFALIGCGRPPAPPTAPVIAEGADDAWLDQVVYLALTDRFANGDPTNDTAPPADCYDPKDPKLFHGGDLAGLRAHVPYLAELGVTALWVTPLYAQVPLRDGSCGYHGYWADYGDPDDGALEAKLGSWRDVEALVTSVHDAGMRFILDMVVNHSGRGARIVGQHPEWFHDEGTCASLGDPVVFCPLHGLPDFAEERPEVARYLTASATRWARRVRPDGIRLDTAKHLPSSYLARSFVPGVREARRDMFLLAEVFDTTSIAHVRPFLDAGMDSAFHFPLRDALVETFARGGPVRAVGEAVRTTIDALGLHRALRLVTMLDNHDLPRFMTTAPPGMGEDELSRRYASALTALFTLPGIPQIYQGDELGMVGAYPDNRRDMPQWGWDAAGRAGRHEGTLGDGQATWSLVQTLARLRIHERALARGAYVELAPKTEAGLNVLAFTRRAPPDTNGKGSVLVVVGDDARGGAVTIPLDRDGPWRDGAVLVDVLGRGGQPRTVVHGGEVVVTLPPFVAAIYREEA